MIGKGIDLIGGAARGLVLGLALLAAGNVVWQMYTHKTTALTAWKGGGFGMYTEPHVDTRSVWLTFSGEGDQASLRLWPEAELMRDWRAEVSLKGSTALGKVTAQAKLLRFFPRDRDARKLLALAKRIRWRADLAGGVMPKEGKAFAIEALSLQVFENAYDIAAQKLNRVSIYTLGGGDQ